jgi:hypothetical protein
LDKLHVLCCFSTFLPYGSLSLTFLWIFPMSFLGPQFCL